MMAGLIGEGNGSRHLRPRDQAAGKGFALSIGSDGHCTVPFGQGGECVVEVPDNDDVQAFYLYIPLLRLPADEPSQFRSW